MQEENNTIIVSIRCITYNHAPYIRQCLDGFVMQKTNFRFEAIVHDDASTDGTDAIVREYAAKYPDIIKPIFETENQWSKHDGSLHRIMTNACKGKYIAMCEGDDYWIDPNKLQKQVDFLESHPDYTLIGSNGIIMYTDVTQGLVYFNNHHELREVSIAELVNTWAFPTATLCFRREIFDHYPTWSKELHFGDDVMVMTCALLGKVATLGEVSSVYRKGSGITKDLDKQQEYMAEQHKLFYTHLLEDTGDKYKDVLSARIERDERNRRYWHARSKSKMLAAVMFPKRTCKLIVLGMANGIKSVVKKCLRIA